VWFSDGNYIDADASHDWITEDKLYRKSISRFPYSSTHRREIHTTEEIKNTLMHGKENNHSIPICKPLSFSEKELPIDPYILGVWLGDGTTKQGEVTTADREILESIIENGYGIRNRDRYTWRVYGLQKELRTLGVLGLKHIPHTYSISSIHQRLELLRGLMDTDGTISKYGHCEFTTVKQGFAMQVLEIIQSLGIKAVVGEYDCKLYGRYIGKKYRITFTTNLSVFKLTHKRGRQKIIHKSDISRRFITKVEEIPSIPVKCLEVDSDSHLFLAGKGLVATHNTMLCAFIVIWDALQNPKHNIWIVAPTFPLTDILWEMVIEYLPKSHVRQVFEGRKLIELKNGSRIWAKSADTPQSLVGRGLDLIVFDEASMCDVDAWNYMRPALGDRKGRCIFPTTPKGKNWFYTIFNKDPKRGGDDPDYVSFQYPSMDNEFLDPREFVSMTKDLPELMYRQEILAEFIESGGEVFRNLNRVLRDTLKEPIPEHFYVGGGDLAKYQDFTVITIADLATNEIVYYERFNHLDWDYQKVRIASALKRYNDAVMYMDSTGVGDPIVEDLQRQGCAVKSYKFSQTTKKQAIENLMKMVDDAIIGIPNLPEIKHEFEIFGYEQSPGGAIRYCAPDNGHDDIVISVALCAWGLDQNVGAAVVGMSEVDDKIPQFDEQRQKVKADSHHNVCDWHDDEDRVVDYEED
jgi:hypothetical protein